MNRQVADTLDEFLSDFDRDPRQAVYRRMYQFMNSDYRQGHWDLLGKRPRILGTLVGDGSSILALYEYGPAPVVFEPDERRALRLMERFEDWGAAVEVVNRSLSDAIPDLVQQKKSFDYAVVVGDGENLSLDQIERLLCQINSVADRVLVAIVNRNSLYALWSRLRGFRSDLTHYLTPGELEQAMLNAGWDPIYRKGFGLISPISMKTKFEGTIVQPWMYKATRVLDLMFPRNCFLYFVEGARVPGLDV